MNKDNLFSLLRSLREKDIICYAYRESAFHLLFSGKEDTTLHLVTDASAEALSEALKARDFKNISVNGQHLEARLIGQPIKIRLVNGENEQFQKIVTQPLTVNSLLVRDDGAICDEVDGELDIKNKVLRRTKVPIQDKIAFCSMCLEMTVKHGFVPDKSVREEMKKAVTLPLPKKASLLFMIRSVIRSSHFNVEWFLNTLEYDGLFTNTGKMSREKADALGKALHKAEPETLILFLCSLAGLKGDQLKAINNLHFSKESYDKVLKILKEDGADSIASLEKQLSGQELSVGIALVELTTLLSGKNFIRVEPASGFFRDFDAGDFWKKQQAEPTKPEVNEPPTLPKAEETKSETTDAMQEMFGGVIEEKYEDEDVEEISAPTQSIYGLRNPGDNIFVNKNRK